MKKRILALILALTLVCSTASAVYASDLATINAATDEATMKTAVEAAITAEVLDGTVYNAFTTSYSKELVIANLLEAKTAATEFADTEELKAAWKNALALDIIEVKVNAENYARIVKTTTNTTSGRTRPSSYAAYVNTMYGGYHIRTLAQVATFNFPLKSYVKAMVHNKFTNSVNPYNNGGSVYVYAATTDFPVDPAAGSYAQETELFTELNTYTNDFWGKSSATTANGMTKIVTLTASKGKGTSYGVKVASDFTIPDTYIATLQSAQTNKITIGINSQSSSSNGSVYYWKANFNSVIPNMTVAYSKSGILEYINATTEESIAETIANLGVSGVLDLSETKYDGYKSLKDTSKESVHRAILSSVNNGGYTDFDNFFESYDNSVKAAQNEVMIYPKVQVDFNDKIAENTGTDKTIVPEIKGGSFSTGPDGSSAFKVENDFGATAQQYLDLGKSNFGEDSFSIVFWMKAENGGFGTYATASSELGASTPINFSTLAESVTLPKGGVVISNKDFSTNENTGFALTAMPFSSDFGTNFKIGENPVYNKNAVQWAVEGRWHQIALVIDRKGNAVTYVDNMVVSSTTASTLEGTIDGSNANLILGADGLGQYGMMLGEFDNLRVYDFALTSDRVNELYYITSLNKLNYDIETLLASEQGDIYPENSKDIIKEQLNKSKSFAEEYNFGDANLLKSVFEETEAAYNKFLGTGANGTAVFVSDAHISESSETHRRAVRFINAMTEYESIGLDPETFIISGDYSDVGGKHQHLFFNMFDKYWGATGKNTVIVRGNHDEPASSSTRTVTNADGTTSAVKCTRTFLVNEFKQRMDKYVNKTLSQNQSVIAENGSLAQPYYYSTDGIAHYIGIDNYAPTVKKISTAQLNWLEGVLDSINGDGKPIFIVQHGPISYLTNGTTLTNMLQKYDNVFLLCGHTHYGFGTGEGTTLKQYGKVWQINAPALKNSTTSSTDYADRGYPESSGYYIQVYDDMVVFRARDFVNKKWLEDYNMTFALTPVETTSTTLGKITIYDENMNSYSTIESAAGKEVSISVPVTIAEETADYTAILAAYSGSTLKTAKTQPVSVNDSNITFTITVPEGTTQLKVMLWDNLTTMIPVCDSVVK